jgi:hypothetical protein
MASTTIHDQALRLLARVLGAGAVVEIGERALVIAAGAGPVVPHDRSGTWPGFVADEPGVFACCPLLPGLPAAVLPPAARGWLHLGHADELPELAPLAEWLAAMNEAGLRSFIVGLLHGLERIAETPAGAPSAQSRPVVRAPDNLAREFLD